MPDVNEYKCPTCGAPMRFDVNTQKMVCSFCLNAYDLDYIRSHFNEATSEKSDDFDWIERTKNNVESSKPQKLVEYSCPSCGGSIITFSNRTKAKCPFCEHDLIISTNFKGDIRPDKIIPFSQTFKNFADVYWGYIANSKYIPMEFKDRNFAKKVVGRYIPIWLYSCSCSATEQSPSNAEFILEDYPIPGTNFDHDVFYEIEPFRYNEAEDFTESCLSGFYASRYTIGAEKAMKNADREIQKYASMYFSDSAQDCDHKFEAKQYLTIIDKKLTYYLIPVWMMKVQYKNKEYTFAMNGQTGEFFGGELFLEYRRMGDEKEKKYNAINKKASRYLKLIVCIYILLLILIIILDHVIDDEKTFISEFIHKSSVGLWIDSIKLTAVIFGIIYAVKLIKANPFKYNATIDFQRHMRTIKDFVRDEKKTVIEPTADNKNETPNE